MDIASLFAFLGQNPEFAPQLDALGIPAPDMGQIMKLGGPGAGTPDPGALIPSLMPGAMTGAGMDPNLPGTVPPGIPTGTAMAPGVGATGVSLPEGAMAPEGNPAMSLDPVTGRPVQGGQNNKALAALAGLKAFEPPKAPMHGGVTGSKAPDVLATKAGVPSIQALLAAALGGGGSGGGVPSLGSLIRG